MPAEPASRRTTLLCVLWAALVIATLVGLSSCALSGWFRSDDFMLLLRAMQPGFNPWTSLWPVAERYWWAYRPLGTELYVAACYAMFGLHAGGYHLVTLAVHAANALLVARLARVLGLSGWSPALAGFVYLSAPALSLHLMRVATFHYQAATLCTLACLLCHVRWLASGRTRCRLWGASWFGLGLLCNRSVLLAVPLVLFLCWLGSVGTLRADRFRRCALAVAPLLGLGALAVGLERLVFKSLSTHRYYGLFLDGDVHRRLGALVGHLVGDWPGTWLCLFAVALVAFLERPGARSPARIERDAHTRTALALSLFWLGLSLGVATLLFYLPHVRFVFVAVAPLSLLLAALFERGVPTAIKPPVCVVACALWLPSLPLWQRARAPIDAPIEAAYELVKANNPDLARPIVIAYGAPNLADAQTLERYRLATFRFAHLRLIAPQAPLRLRLLDLSRDPPPTTPTPLLLTLHPDLTLTGTRFPLLTH